MKAIMIRYCLLVVLLGTITSCRSVYVPSVKAENVRIADQAYPEDSSIVQIIDPYKAKLEMEMGETIGLLDHDLHKKKPESTMGNWVADIILKEAQEYYEGNIDFAVQNYGGIRISHLASGPILLGEVYELMPFDNVISVLQCNGADLKIFLDHVAKDGGWPVSQNLQFRISNGMARDILIHGKPIDDSTNYTFALPDYIANGGSGSFFLKDYQRTDLNYLIRDAIIEHIRKAYSQGIDQSARIEGRIKNDGE